MKTLACLLIFLSFSPIAHAEVRSKHDFKDIREGLIRQMSPEGQYCRECHQRKVTRKPRTPPITQVPIPASALLFAAGLGTVYLASRKKNKNA